MRTAIEIKIIVEGTIKSESVSWRSGMNAQDALQEAYPEITFDLVIKEN